MTQEFTKRPVGVEKAIDFYEQNGLVKTDAKISDNGTPPMPEFEMVLRAKRL